VANPIPLAPPVTNARGFVILRNPTITALEKT